MSNTSNVEQTPAPNFKPLGDRVIVRLNDRKTQTDGGIVLPERSQRAEEWGTVLSGGPEVQDLIPGDVVYISSHLGTHYILQGLDFIIIEESKILCRKER